MILIWFMFSALIVIGGIVGISSHKIDCGVIRAVNIYQRNKFQLYFDDGLGPLAGSGLIQFKIRVEQTSFLDRGPASMAMSFGSVIPFSPGIRRPMIRTCFYNINAYVKNKTTSSHGIFTIHAEPASDCVSGQPNDRQKLGKNVERCLSSYMNSPSFSLNTPTEGDDILACNRVFDSLGPLVLGQSKNRVAGHLDILLPKMMHDLLRTIGDSLDLPDLHSNASEAKLDAFQGTIRDVYKTKMWKDGLASTVRNGTICQISAPLLLPSTTLIWDLYTVTGKESVYGEAFILGLENSYIKAEVNFDVNKFPCGLSVKFSVLDGSIGLIEEPELDAELIKSITKHLPYLKESLLESISDVITSSVNHKIKQSKCSKDDMRYIVEDSLY